MKKHEGRSKAGKVLNRGFAVFFKLKIHFSWIFSFKSPLSTNFNYFTIIFQNLVHKHWTLDSEYQPNSSHSYSSDYSSAGSSNKIASPVSERKSRSISQQCILFFGKITPMFFYFFLSYIFSLG